MSRPDLAALPVAQWAHHAVGDGARGAIYRAHYHAKVNNDGPPPTLPRESRPIHSPLAMTIARTALRPGEADPAVHRLDSHHGETEHRQGAPDGRPLHDMTTYEIFRARDKEMMDSHTEVMRKRALGQ